MRSGKYSMLEMMSPTPCAGLDEDMARALTLASQMEFETLELEVWLPSCIHSMLADSGFIVAFFFQGVVWEHNQMAFQCLLDLIGAMRGAATLPTWDRRPIKAIRMSRAGLPDGMVRRLVATILALPRKPQSQGREILEIQKVGR